ncbi:MAG: hypothetical protein AAB587_01695 [Patescibacteria group bacterium]
MNLSILKKKSIIVFLILNVVAGGIYAALFFYVEFLEERTTTFISEAQADIKKSEAVSSMKAILRDSGSDLTKIQSYFVSPDGVVSLVESLESLGEVSRVSLNVDSIGIDTARVKDPKATSTPATIATEVLRLKISTSGGWKETMHFLSLLETLPLRLSLERSTFLFDIESESVLLFNPPKGTKLPSSRTWTGTFEFIVFKLKGDV